MMKLVAVAQTHSGVTSDTGRASSASQWGCMVTGGRKLLYTSLYMCTVMISGLEKIDTLNSPWPVVAYTNFYTAAGSVIIIIMRK